MWWANTRCVRCVWVVQRTVCPEYTWDDDTYSDSSTVCRRCIWHALSWIFRWNSFLWIRRFRRDKIIIKCECIIHFEWTLLKNPPWLQFLLLSYLPSGQRRQREKNKRSVRVCVWMVYDTVYSNCVWSHQRLSLMAFCVAEYFLCFFFSSFFISMVIVVAVGAASGGAADADVDAVLFFFSWAAF